MRKPFLFWGLALAVSPAVWGTVSGASAARPRMVVQHRTIEPVALVQASDAVGRPKAETPSKAAIPSASSMVEIDAFREVRGKAIQLRGSGVIASQFGHIYAPYFVAQDADVLLVTFKDGSRVPARLVSADRRSQLAVLKVSNPPEGIQSPTLCVPSAETTGRIITMVYADGETVRTATGVVAGEREAVGPLKNVLEVLLPAQAKVSGGLMFDQTGALVGLALATAPGDDPKNQSVYALPASRIKESVDRMVRGEEGTVAPKQVALTEA